MLRFCKLPLQFDAAQLKADVDGLTSGEWISHFNTTYYEGTWNGIALRSPGGTAGLYPDPTADSFADTAMLARCGYLRAVLQTFKCPLTTVRLLKLASGSKIREHRDLDLGDEAGEVRLHIPVVTNPQVEFFLDGVRVVMQEGECWYLNFSLPHRVDNLGATDRVHLVIDCQVNDWLRDLIASAGSAGDEVTLPAWSTARSGFDAFHAAVLADVGLQQKLRDISDRDGFIATTIEVGREHGYAFTPGDVEDAMRTARRAWVERRLR